VWNKVVANLTGIPDLPQGMVGGPVTLGPKGEQVNRTATPVQADQEAQKAAETEKLDKQRTAVAKFNESVNTNFETRKLIESGSAFNQMKSQVAAANAAAAEEKKDPKNKSGMQGGYDVAIIELFNIALEPNSVVRDAEYETARKSGGIVASAINMIENLRTGQVLTPEQRAMLLNAAQQLVEGRLSSHNKYLEMRKRGEIDTLGLPKELADTIQPWKMDDLTTYDHPLARLGFRGNKYGSPTLGRSTDPIVLPSALNKEQIGVYGQVLRKYADQTKDNVYVVDPETGSLLEIAPTTPPAPPAPPTQPGPVAPSYPRPIGPPTQEEKKAGDWADVMRMIPTNPTLLF
jgi:hypothetical protein